MKQVKNILTLFLLTGLTAFFACKKEHLIGDKVMVLTYDQTQCADPWGYGTQDSVTINKLFRYLDSAGLNGPLFHIALMGDNVPANCTACTCKTGRIFYVSVLQSEVLKQKYLNAGFTFRE